MLGKIKETCSYLQKQSKERPEAGIILGSGLGSFIDTLTHKNIIPYSSIPHFPVSSVEGHEGNLIFGRLGNVPVITLQGRLHVYEGHPVVDTVFPVRV
ncbi:MAG: purine-nucleoside phosphorylase, partial [Bacteroidetes bacterium]|nr:purine-nucleoside phosphorylase [Bacteroidota bacterium]